MSLEDPLKWVISTTMIRQGDVLVIQIQNYYEGELAFEDGLPVTTHGKEGELHGYGMKSIQKTVQKYNGSVVASQENNWFMLRILIPLE